MKAKKSISCLILVTAIFSLFATVLGIFTRSGPGEHTFTTIFGQVVTIYGKGIYGNNTVVAAMQAIPQDMVTLIIGIPLLVISFVLARSGSLKGKILLAGTLGYFLITYMMYTFIAMYNRLFLVYVMLMSASLFAFILTLLEFNIGRLHDAFGNSLPIRFVGGYLLFSTTMIGLLWLARTIPTLLYGAVPSEVELGTTLTVQAFDLAFFLPGMFLSGLLLIKRSAFGFLFAPVSTVTNALIMIALLSKGISMQLAGIPGALPMIVMMVLFSILASISVAKIMKSINDPKAS